MDIIKSSENGKDISERIKNCEEIDACIVQIPEDVEETAVKLGPEVIASMCVTLINISVGMTFAFSSVVVPQLEKAGTATVSQTSIIASVIALSAPVGSLLGAVTVDKFGRIATIKMAFIPNIAGWFLIAIADSIQMVVIGRILCGFSIAVSTSVTNVYIAEISRPKYRGSLLSFGNVMTSLGMVLMYLQGGFFSWSTVAWIALFVSLFPFMLISSFSPESPSWLISRTKYEKAMKALNQLVRSDAQKDIHVIRYNAMIEQEASRKLRRKRCSSLVGKFRMILSRPTTYKPFIIVQMLFICQQLTGSYLILVYAGTFFQKIHSGINIHLASTLLGVTRLIFGIIVFNLLRTHGRRPLCLFSAATMSVSMFVLAYFTRQISLGNTTSFTTYGPVLCCVAFVACGTLGIGTVPLMMAPEVFPLQTRAFCSATMLGITHLFKYAILRYYRDVEEAIGGSWMFQCLMGFNCLIAFVYCFIFLPETHNVTLDHIESYFERNFTYVFRKPSSQPLTNDR